MDVLDERKVADFEKIDEAKLIAALQNSARGSFPVTYEIFASPNRKKLAYLERDISEKAKRPAHDFVLILDRTKANAVPLEEAEVAKTNHIASVRAAAPKPAEILERIAVHAERYRKLKEYFQTKTKELGLENPLIFFDDKALRIDIGYGLKEVQAIFPDFSYDINDYIQRDYSIFLEAEQARITQAANIKFSEPLPVKTKITLEEEFSEETLIKQCLQNSSGLVIGEKHQERSAKQFLIDNMALLKSQGVTTLYLEHLMHERHQALLNAYLTSPADAAMPRELEIYLNYLDNERGSPPTLFTAVVQAAKKNGIRVIAVDADVTYRVGVALTHADLGAAEERSAKRFSIMNMAMLEHLNKDHDNKKYVALVGNGHVSTCLGIPGVSDLLGCPNIVVHDLSKAQPQEKIEQNVQYQGDASKNINFDFLYHRNPETKLKNSEAIREAEIRAGAAPEKEKVETQIQELLDTHEISVNKNLRDSRFKLDANSHSLVDKNDFKVVFSPDGSIKSDLCSDFDDPTIPQNLADMQIAVVKTLQALFRATNGAYPKVGRDLYLIQKGLTQEETQKVAKNILPQFKEILKEALLKPNFDDIRHLITIEKEPVIEIQQKEKADHKSATERNFSR